jgi:nitrite reductase (NADH) large subunit
LFSVGEFQEGEGSESLYFSDPAIGIYKKLVIKNNKLAGVVL